jgi:membrane associated rhomboid family serine protease
MIPLRDVIPSRTPPYITVTIILLNAATWLFEISMPPDVLQLFLRVYGVVPADFRPVTLITSMFLHGGWMHLLGNMWFLWIFGDNIEDILGPSKYLAFYLGCGVVAALTQTLLSPDQRAPMVGASGAIAGVMGAYIVKFPHSRILSLVTIIFFFTTIEVPAWVMLIYWFGVQFVSGVGSIANHASQGGVAFFAHVGGFVTGAALINLLAPRDRYTRRRDVYW